MSLKVINDTDLLLLFVVGQEHVDVEIEATAEGLELGSHGVIPWAWIDKARAGRRDVSAIVTPLDDEHKFAKY